MDKPGPLMVVANPRVNHCQKPKGWLGRLFLRNMNSRHAKVTDWGLAQIRIARSDTILDVGCGGGRTVSKLAAVATEGKVYGVDYSKESVSLSARMNRRAIDKGLVEIIEASVSQLPFSPSMFDLITAVETHFWWPDLPGDMREVFRVLKPGGTLVVIAEIYKGANTTTAKFAEKYLPSSGMALLSIDDHRELLTRAGFSKVQISTQPDKGWICCIASKN
jgi:ubiquinone/menaquinone biosynthesis C-methylase UbiE